MDDNSGFVKLVTDRRAKKLLGAHLIAGVTGMVAMDADICQMAATVYPHPTLSEAIMETAHALRGHAVHI